MQFKCKICDTELDLDKCQVFKSKCIANGSDLTRYKCTTCGVIFGTIPMITGTEEMIKNDYIALDKGGWKEPDLAMWETKTFMTLNPQKGHTFTYLNFGSGNTCSTIEKLRANGNGYNIFGYEPYLPVDAKEIHVIRTKEELMKHKFDAIMSNNLIEHLQDPVNDFLFMKSLLKDKTSIMAHSTACYRYCYEFSRFHTFFFVDKSIEYLCNKTGLILSSLTAEGDYINGIFSQKP